MERYNTNSKVANYGDFCNNWESEKEKLKKAKRGITPNSDRQQFVRNSKTEYNPVTHKLTDYTKDEIEDTLDKMDELEKSNESLNSNYVVKLNIPEKAVNHLREVGVAEDKIERCYKYFIEDTLGIYYDTYLSQLTNWTEESDNIVDFMDENYEDDEISEKKSEKPETIEECPSFKEFNKKISDLKKLTKKIHGELKGNKGEIDDYIEKKIFGRDV